MCLINKYVFILILKNNPLCEFKNEVRFEILFISLLLKSPFENKMYFIRDLINRINTKLQNCFAIKPVLKTKTLLSFLIYSDMMLVNAQGSFKHIG